jgi:hypothetical protein
VKKRLVCAILAIASNAAALDKQGSAHGGGVGDEPGHDTEFNISGGASTGIALVNNSYAARPDNTGLALMRYAVHADIDLIGRRLSLPIDLNTFTDKTRKSALVFVPTEFDVIAGVTTTDPVTKGVDVELGTRFEHDRPVDRGGFTQSYVDARTRALYSLGKIFPGLAHDLVEGDVSGWLGLGWFVINPTYAARPDNTGNALFRYMGHTELSIVDDHFSVGLDGTMFTDRREHALRPSELDATYEIIGRLGHFELHVAYERDMPIDRRGLIQDFVYALFVYDFDLRHDVLQPLEQRGHILSP